MERERTYWKNNGGSCENTVIGHKVVFLGVLVVLQSGKRARENKGEKTVQGARQNEKGRNQVSRSLLH